MKKTLKTIIYEQKGHSSVTVLIALFIISALFLGATLTTRTSLLKSKKISHELQSKTEREKLVKQVIGKFENDPSPESHSPYDPVWDYIAEDHSPYTLELHDISSRLNINWLRTKLFEETDLGNLIISGEHPDVIRSTRSSKGFTMDISSWEETFGEENLAHYFTVYSLANVNVTYDESLHSIYEARHGENGSQIFMDKIQEGLSEFKLWDKEELPFLLGLGEDDMVPVLTTIPQMNVHFIDPFLLQCILSYPYREDRINNYLLKYNNILSARKNQEITEEKLKALIGPNDKQLRVLEYLGTLTTFWKLTISQDNNKASYIIYFDGENWGLFNFG
jgi:hypothetical protein